MGCPLSRTAVDLLLAVTLLVAAPMRTICYDSCVSDADSVPVDDPAVAACHEGSDASVPSHGEPSDDGCRHGDEAPAEMLRAAPKLDDQSGGAPHVAHYATEAMNDVAPAVYGSVTPVVTLHAASPPLHAPPPLRL